MKFYVNACVRLTLHADSEQEALEDAAIAVRAVEEHVDDFDALGVSVTRPPYRVPAGAERWARTAEEIRFAEDRVFGVRALGAVWWSDQRAMLRLEGSGAPVPEIKVKVPTDAELRLDAPLRRIGWGELFATTSWHPYLVRAATIDGAIVAQDKYIPLVEGAFPEGAVEWWAGADVLVPIRAVVDGRVEALVMGCRP